MRPCKSVRSHWPGGATPCGQGRAGELKTRPVAEDTRRDADLGSIRFALAVLAKASWSLSNGTVTRIAGSTLRIWAASNDSPMLSCDPARPADNFSINTGDWFSHWFCAKCD